MFSFPFNAKLITISFSDLYSEQSREYLAYLTFSTCSSLFDETSKELMGGGE